MLPTYSKPSWPIYIVRILFTFNFGIPITNHPAKYPVNTLYLCTVHTLCVVCDKVCMEVQSFGKVCAARYVSSPGYKTKTPIAHPTPPHPRPSFASLGYLGIWVPIYLENENCVGLDNCPSPAPSPFPSLGEEAARQESCCVSASVWWLRLWWWWW